MHKLPQFSAIEFLWVLKYLWDKTSNMKGSLHFFYLYQKVVNVFSTENLFKHHFS